MLIISRLPLLVEPISSEKYEIRKGLPMLTV